ncbi:Papain family cysteine protease [compost metagenome]
MHSLASLQNPVTISILAHPETWENSVKTGHLFLTERLKRECQKKLKPCSGHAALIVGYDLEKRIFYFKNSWGTDWGIDGYGTIPFDYIDQMSKRKLITGRLLTNEL